jgi:alpha/beta superfamily hydrolase
MTNSTLFTPPKPQALTLSGPAGDIEASLEAPVDFDGQAVALVCHPHPLYGGSMTNKVVHMAARALQELNMVTLKFNFRGVGLSQGSFDEGRGETLDALVAYDALRQRFPQASITLVGFSFGSFIAYKVATQRAARQLICIAPPVQRFDFKTSPVPPIPWSIIQGDKDDLVDHDSVLQWARELIPPPHVQLLTGAEHFFHGRMSDLKNCVKNCVLREANA